MRFIQEDGLWQHTRREHGAAGESLCAQGAGEEGGRKAVRSDDVGSTKDLSGPGGEEKVADTEASSSEDDNTRTTLNKMSQENEDVMESNSGNLKFP